MTLKNNFYKINPKNQKDLIDLFNIAKITKKPFLESLFPKEITNYLFYFFDENFYKNKIEFDEFSYYLISEDSKTIGFFGIKNFNDILFISDIFITKENHNKGIGKKVVDFIKNKAKELNLKILQTSIYQNDKNSEFFFKKLNFKKISTQARYLGSDIYLLENVFEFS